jgi:hypothetical protein
MGSKITIANDTQYDWTCEFSLVGGGQPAGGYQRTELLGCGLGQAVSMMTKKFPLGLPINLVIWNKNNKANSRIKTLLKSPGSNKKEKLVNISELLSKNSNNASGPGGINLSERESQMSLSPN